MPLVTALPFHIDRRVFLARLRLEETDEMAGELLDLAARAEKAARPKAVFRDVAVEARDAGGIVAGGVRFNSRAMAVTLKGVDRIFPYVCTCGVELDALPLLDDGGFSRFGLDIIKEMALRRAVDALHDRLLDEFKLDHKASMNPGSGDRDLWPLEEQGALFRLLGDVRDAIGVTLTESWLMLPNKSVSGFYFKTETGYRNCRLCKRESCPNRSAPFDPTLWAASMLGHGTPDCGSTG